MSPAVSATVVSQRKQLGTPQGDATRSLTSTPRPKTPLVMGVKQDWYGLPSPQTPSCKGHLSNELSMIRTPGSIEEQDDWKMNEIWTDEPGERKARSSFSPITPCGDSSSELIGTVHLLEPDQFISLTTIAGEAELTFEPSSSTSTRRSTRSRARLEPRGMMILLEYHFRILVDKLEAVDVSKEQNKAGKSHGKNLSPASEQVDSAAITQAAPTESPFDVAVTSSIEMPGLHSTEWQLMYPPGGSTHPAYPWPNTDPRLTFHTHYVPLNNGLPDTSYVHTLALPMGWHQACWSGLHPVVFDSYRQAFKLTPVGPLPLTSEEVHQGGLQDYVPGGKLHPEFGMLPLLSKLSDGSDAEVYNFDGVDWVLPWAYVGDISGFGKTRSSPASTHFAVSATHALLTMQLPPRYLETRDCPDNVFDLQDGWRWLTTMQQVSPDTFIPTPGRKWLGTGVRRASRRTKQPIAALMAITMAEKDEDNAERYLANQNLREFCPFKSLATPVHIDITLLGDIEFTLVELMSYFPQHYQWRKAGERMVRAGLSAMDISNFVNLSRRLPGASICSSSSVSYFLARKFEDELREETTQSFTQTTSYTAEEWTYSSWETTDYPLLALTHGLVELPSGVDAGPLTTLIKWVRDLGRYQSMLSEVPAILEEANINGLIDPDEEANPDKEVLPRHANAMKEDRRRVLEELRALREGEEIETEAADAAVVLKERKTKKRKLV